ncbi:hypothetical protein AVEN_64147-1 [Araneus ventricosus]|uniref:Uncharacterized protein n=1 Tax=Araneus ventricosus TaxID=182803 RepID=A0A4Y2C4S2_ARAVE|nr:hypothetical protein AVEN_64147-1 [Araneus ventricosus]
MGNSLLLLSYLNYTRSFLLRSTIEVWQTSWNNGDIGKKIYNIMPSVSLRPTNRIREDVIFFSEHGPFPEYLKRFHLFDCDQCNLGGDSTALHYVTECALQVPWNMRTTVPKSEQENGSKESPIISCPGEKFIG